MPRLPKGVTVQGLNELMKSHLPGMRRGAWHETPHRTQITSIAVANGDGIQNAKKGTLMIALDVHGNLHTYRYKRGDLAPELTQVELPKKHQEFIYREMEKKRNPT